MADKERVVGLVLKARDEYSKVLGSLVKQGNQAQIDFITKNRKAHNDYNAQITELSAKIRQMTIAQGAENEETKTAIALRAKLIASASKLERTIDGVASARPNRGSFALFDKLAKDIDVSSNKLERLRTELSDTRNAMSKIGSQQPNWHLPGIDPSMNVSTFQAQKNFSAYQRLAGAAQYLESEILQLETAQIQVGNATELATTDSAAQVPVLNEIAAATNNATVATNKLTAARRAAASSGGRMSGSQSALAGAAGRNRGKKGDAQEIEMFGLKPWQLTNLGYQVNDVISGVAMGQPMVQIAAQQAGQFAQIWPKAMVAVAKKIPYIAVAAAIMAPLIGAMNDIAEENASIDFFNKGLGINVDTSRYISTELAAIVNEVKGVAGGIDNARKALIEFANAGVDTARMEELARIAGEYAEVSGVEVPAAAKKFAEAFGGNMDSVRDLDKELNFLTADQLEHLRTLTANGEGARAMAEAQSLLTKRIEAATPPLTQMQIAAQNFGETWQNVKEWVGDSAVFSIAASAVNLLAAAFGGLALAAKDLTSTAKRDPTKQWRLDQKRLELEQQIAEARAAQADSLANGGGAWAVPDEVIRTLEAKLAAVNAELDALTAHDTHALDKTTAELEAQKKAAQDINTIVGEHITKLNEELATQNLTKREQYIQNDLLETRNAALAKANELGTEFLGLTEAQVAAVREAAGLAYDTQFGASDVAGTVGSYVNKVVGIESAGVADAKNPLSTATGLGQFIETTWLDLFRRHFPTQAADLTRQQILDLRKDTDTSRQMIQIYAEENAKMLQDAGASVSELSLYLAHFLGPQGAAKVLNAVPSTPISQLLSSDQIAANQGVLGAGATAGSVTEWASNKMGTSDSEIAGAQAIAAVEAERAKTATEYNQGLAERLTAQSEELRLLGMAGREAAIQKALQDETLAATKAGVELTAAQRQEIIDTTGALYDRQNIETRTNQLLAQRAELMTALALAKADGNQEDYGRIFGEVQDVDKALNAAIDSAIAFWRAIGGPEADTAILKLQNLKAGLEEVPNTITEDVLPKAEELNREIVDIAGNAFSDMAKALASGENAATAFFDSVLQGLGEMIISIGKAIIQQAILNAIMGATGGMSGGIGNSLAGAVASIFHEGGQPGITSAPSRTVNPAMFSGAQRYHVGGIPGLKPGEVPVIAMNTEEIITADDPRHVRNGGKSGMKVKNVNVFRPEDVIQAALQSEIGEKVIMNFITGNARGIRGALGV